MRTTITTLILFIVVSFSGFAQQNNDQQELYEVSKKIAYQVTEQINLDEDEFVFLTRAIYSYKIGMHKIALSIESGASEDEINSYTHTINEQLNTYIKDMFSADKSSKLMNLLSESLSDL